MADIEKKALDEQNLDQAAGGAYKYDAQCDCPSCGKRIVPQRRGGKLFCPQCGVQVGGVMNGCIF